MDNKETGWNHLYRHNRRCNHHRCPIGNLSGEKESHRQLRIIWWNGLDQYIRPWVICYRPSPAYNLMEWAPDWLQPIQSGTDDQPRTYDVFFLGEKLVLKAETTDIQGGSQVTADQVTVQILNPSYSAVLQNTGNNEWEGSIWSSEMLAWTSRTLTFRFTATYSNGTVKTDEVQIRIDDDPYWRQHGSY